MTDVAKPSDPYGLLGNNWPPQSANSYSDAHTILTTWSSSMEDASHNTSRNASSTREQFKGQTGTSVSDKLDDQKGQLSSSATSLHTKADAMFNAEQKLSKAKWTISQTTQMGTRQIDATLEAERSGSDLPYKMSSSALIADFQQRIAEKKAELDTDMASITSTLNGHGPTGGTHSFTNTGHEQNTGAAATPTGWKNNMKDRGVDIDNPVSAHPQMPQVPLDSGSPSGPSASPGISPASMTSATPMATPAAVSASPVSGTSGPSPSAGIGAPKPSTEAPRAPSTTNPTLNGLLNPPTPSGPPASAMGNPSGGSSHGPEHAPPQQHQSAPPPGPQRDAQAAATIIPIPTGLDGAATLAGGVLGAASSATDITGPLTGHGHTGTTLPTGTPPPVAPLPTGQTPGVSSPAPGLGPVGPQTTVPPTVQANPAGPAISTPGTTPGTATPGVSTPGPGGPVTASPMATGPAAPPSAVPQASVAHAAGTHPSASPGAHVPDSGSSASPLLSALGAIGVGASLLAGKSGEDLDAALQALPPVAFDAHCVLASLVQSFMQAGWGGSIAVAALSDASGNRWYAYATADGLSAHPTGLAVPVNTFPLAQVPGIPDAPELFGSQDLYAKLSLLQRADHTVLTAVSTWVRAENQVADTTFHYQEAPVRNRIIENGLAAPLIAPMVGELDFPTVAPIVLTTRTTAIPPMSSVCDVLRGQRWVGDPPAGYLDIMMVFLVSQVCDALTQGRYAEASATAGEAQRLSHIRKHTV